MSNTIIKNSNTFAIPVTIDKEFGELINSIDKNLLAIEGMTREYLDISKRYDDYSKSNLDVYSIEGNSNIGGSKNYLNRHAESYKALDKILNYQMLWREVKENFGLEEANKCIKEAIEGSSLVHDMTNNGIDSLYCTTMPAKFVMNDGRPYNDVPSKAPTKADSYMGQIIEMIIDVSSRFCGAVAIPDINVAFSYYTKKENLSDKQVEQLYQRLVHLVNNPYRVGSQSPFFNMGLFTETGLVNLFGDYQYPNGDCAIDYIDEIKKNQLIFAKYFGKGIEINNTHKPVGFPVVTFNIVRDNIKEDYEYIKKIVECFNTFNNVNLYVGDSDKISYCCRIVDTGIKNKALNSFGGGMIGSKVTGSSRVVSINLYDIALQAKIKSEVNNTDIKDEFFNVLNQTMETDYKILYSQRKLVQKTLDDGLNVFYNIGWVKLSDYYSTYGAGGLFEAVKTIFNSDMKVPYTDEELEWGKLVPQFMENFSTKHSNDYITLNVEFLTPLESGADRLGRRINHKYNKRNTFISNQLLPLDIKTTINRRLEIEDVLGGATSAGGILHLSTEGEMPFDMKMKFINKIVVNYPNVEHFAFNVTSAYCEDGHCTFKDVDICPHCGKPIIEKILRTIGYYKPKKNWSAPRKKEKRYFHSIQAQTEFIKDDDKNNDD
jgi:ribonucleoside-triphosphate reductase